VRRFNEALSFSAICRELKVKISMFSHSAFKQTQHPYGYKTSKVLKPTMVNVLWTTPEYYHLLLHPSDTRS
jgi:hypothetical protein